MADQTKTKKHKKNKDLIGQDVQEAPLLLIDDKPEDKNKIEEITDPELKEIIEREERTPDQAFE